MDGPAGQESIRIHRALVFVRLGLAPVFVFLLTLRSRCAPALIGFLILVLAAIAIVPLLVYLFRRDWLAQPTAARVMVLFDFLAVSLVSVIASRNHVQPVFFPLYAFFVAVEAACWWGWAGALIAAAVSGALLNWLYVDVPMPAQELPLEIAALNIGWSIVLGYFTQWALRQWRERRMMAQWLRQQETMVRQVHDRLHGWQATALALQRASSLYELLETALREAEKVTSSPLGLAVLRDHYGGNLHAECWRGFALPDAERTALQPGDRLPARDGDGWVEVRHVLVAPLQPALSSTTPNEPSDLGRLVVARPAGPPYQTSDEQWLNILASFTAALVDNRFLRGQLGRMQQESDSFLQAGWTLSALPDPAAAMELACRNILGTLSLRQVVIFLYGQESDPGCRVVVYPEQGPAETATMPLQGRGLRLLRRFLDAGTSVIFNQRSEWPELFDLMAWKEVQAVACFPLYVLGRCWGALCLLAKAPDAFPPQTQQNLAIFSGEIAMALENYYLRQAISKTGS
jgi:GAF domain-containing protein